MGDKSSDKSKIIPLNIVMTYPVHWGKYEIFRDFVQNFYDSVGYDKWNEKFQYSYKDKKLTMEIEGVVFNYEWLLHIGASTKTANSCSYAGYFGEGFKIASLCAYRDYGWEIEMFSGKWGLNIEVLEQKIDNQNIQMMAYKITNTGGIDGSRLVLSPISLSEYRIFETVLMSFYFPENTMFGEKIWEGEEGAVYKRSQKEIIDGLPYVREYAKKGAVFCGYQMLGTSPFNFIVCLHKYKKKDRERRTLYRYEIIEVFQSISRYIDAPGAIYMLEGMRRYWNSYPHKQIDIYSWSRVIDNLIYKVCQSADATRTFVNKYPNLLCLKRVFSIQERNARSQARSWLSQQNLPYLLVKDTFQKLGYPLLEEECKKQNGFVVDDEVTDIIEIKCFEILENICRQLFEDFFMIGNTLPERRLIINEKASYHGMAVIYKKPKKILNIQGITIRYDIARIYLKKSIFVKNGYYDGLATYMHEFCHIFGSDSSNSFSQALTVGMEILMKNQTVIEDGRKQWEYLFSEQSVYS